MLFRICMSSSIFDFTVLLFSVFWPLAHVLEQDLINTFVLGLRGYASRECSALLCDIFICRVGFSVTFGSGVPACDFRRLY